MKNMKKIIVTSIVFLIISGIGILRQRLKNEELEKRVEYFQWFSADLLAWLKLITPLADKKCKELFEEWEKTWWTEIFFEDVWFAWAECLFNSWYVYKTLKTLSDKR